MENKQNKTNFHLKQQVNGLFDNYDYKGEAPIDYPTLNKSRKQNWILQTALSVRYILFMNDEYKSIIKT